MIARGLFTATFVSGTLWSATGGAVASAEFYRTQSYVYGRFEARVRYAAGDGVVSSFFLWKNGSETAGTFWNELDFEKLGAECYMQTNALYGNPVTGREQRHNMPSTMCSAYHDYAFEWTPTYIAWAIDGCEIRRETGATATAFMQNASAGMNFRFNIWPGNADFGGNFSPSILPVHQYISWVQYSSYDNGSFNRQWREEFDGNSLPSGWAVGNWASPYNLSTHTAQNVTFVNGIAVLSLTADNATGFTGTPPADSGGGAGTGCPANGGAGGGGSGGSSTAGVTGMGGAAGRGGNPSGGQGGGATAGAMSAGGMAAGAMNAGGTTAGEGGGGATSGSGGSDTGGGIGNAGAGGVAANAGAAASGASGSPGFGGVTTGGQGAGAAAGSTGASSPGAGASNDSDAGCGCRFIRSGGGMESSAGALLLLGLLLSRRRNGVRGSR